MASLYIKDIEANELAERLAALRGLTKTAAVKLALRNELANDVPVRPLADLAGELRRTSKLRYDPAVVIDKAFYDSLHDRDDN